MKWIYGILTKDFQVQLLNKKPNNFGGEVSQTFPLHAKLVWNQTLEEWHFIKPLT